jgi:hypothetical protein
LSRSSSVSRRREREHVQAEQHAQGDYGSGGEGGEREGEHVRYLWGAAAGDRRGVAEHGGDPQPRPPDGSARADDQGERGTDQQQLDERARGGNQDLPLQAQMLPPGNPGRDRHQKQ